MAQFQPGQSGNPGGRPKSKPWADAIKRALDKRSDLDAIAEKLVDAAASGDLPALRELGDRLDGKPAQAVTVGNDESGAFTVEQIKRVIVDPRDPDSTSI